MKNKGATTLNVFRLLNRTVVPLQQAPPAADPAWQMHHAPDGRPYWYSPATGVTQWEQPAV